MEQIGVGVAVVVFGLVFALGDFLPSGRYGLVHKGFLHSFTNQNASQSLFVVVFAPSQDYFVLFDQLI